MVNSLVQFPDLGRQLLIKLQVALLFVLQLLSKCAAIAISLFLGKLVLLA